MAKVKLKGGGLTEFGDIINGFVQENYRVTGICRGCSDSGNAEVEADDYKNSYNKALLKLYNKLFGG